MVSKQSERRIRILIADDHPIFRDGLRRLLESEPGFDVIGEAQDGSEAVKLAQRLKPDILLLDLAMPRVTGLGALKDLEAAGLSTRTIMLTAQIERAEIVTALQLGARGIVLKEAATQLLFAAKSQNVPIFVVGPITKAGALAGPKTLEHVVATVLYCEVERHHSHRVVRGV